MASLMAFLIASLDQEKAVLTRCHAILAAGEVTRSTLVRTFPTLEPTLISIIRPPIRFDTSATGVDVDIDALTDAQLDAAETALGAPAAAAATAAAVDGAPDEFSLPSPPAPPPSRNESVDSVDSDALTDALAVNDFDCCADDDSKGDDVGVDATVSEGASALEGFTPAEAVDVISELTLGEAETL